MEDQKRLDKLRSHYKPTTKDSMGKFFNNLGASVGIGERNDEDSKYTSTIDAKGETARLREQKKRRNSYNFKSTLTGGRVQDGRPGTGATGDPANDALLLSQEQQLELNAELNKRKQAADRLAGTLDDDGKRCSKADKTNVCKQGEAWAKGQNENNLKKIQEQAARAVALATEMQDKMQVKRDAFNQVVAEERDQYYKDTQKLMERMREPIDGMDIRMEPGGGIPTLATYY